MEKEGKNKLQLLFGGNGEPIEPDWESIYKYDDDCDIAREQWRQIINEMKSESLLSFANGHAIRRLVEYRVTYECATRHVAKHGAVLPPTEGSTRASGERNPWWAVLRQSDDGICRLESELGISPLRRGKATKVQKNDQKARPADSYIAKKRRKV